MKRIGKGVTHSDHCRFWSSQTCNCFNDPPIDADLEENIRICRNCGQDIVRAGEIVCIGCMAHWYAVKPGYTFVEGPTAPPPENEPWDVNLRTLGFVFLAIAGGIALAWRIA